MMKVNARKIFASFGVNRKVRSVFSARPTVQHTAQLGFYSAGGGWTTVRN